MNQSTLPDASVGLGLRRGLLDAIETAPPDAFDFLECAPENWIHVGGLLGARFDALAARLPITLHGLSLSLGGSMPLDETLLDDIAALMDRHDIRHYSEHLSYSADDGHLYDLMPLAFDEATVAHVARRIDQVQQKLGRRIAIENVSYYAAPWQRMPETEFVNAVLHAGDCDLLLDVNNVYVNAINHGYDARGYIEAMPVVVDPGVLNPYEFIGAVINRRLPNPFMPDAPQRIATDTSQKLAIRFGETIKAYQARGLDKSNLVLIPLVLAGYARYLKGIDDNGKAFEISPDPMLAELQAIVAPLEVKEGEQDFSCLKNLYSRADVFGVDLYEVGLGEQIEGMVKELYAGNGAVRKTLHKYVVAR